MPGCIVDVGGVPDSVVVVVGLVEVQDSVVVGPRVVVSVNHSVVVCVVYGGETVLGINVVG